jgi:hypothetical protein
MSTTQILGPRRLLPAKRPSRLIRTPAFTAREVRQLLCAVPSEPRGQAVARCAARLDSWLPPEPHRIHCPYHAWQHLPRIIFWYGRGESPEEIGRRIASFGTAWGVERALDTACARMADALNRDPAAYGLPRRLLDRTSG